jgi:hypothetical protein
MIQFMRLVLYAIFKKKPFSREKMTCENTGSCGSGVVNNFTKLQNTIFFDSQCRIHKNSGPASGKKSSGGLPFLPRDYRRLAY